MPVRLPSDKIPLEVRLSLEDQYANGHRPLRTVSAVDRRLRHRALRTIFDEMDLQTTTRRKEALRNIGDLMFDYRRLKSLMKKQLPPSQVIKWHKRVAKSASSLLDLLEDERIKATGFGAGFGHSPEFKLELGSLRANADLIVRCLSAIRQNADLSKEGKRLPDLATQRLINSLGYMYTAETGRESGLSRGHQHYDRDPKKHGVPGGPFYRLVAATFALLGEPKTQEQLGNAIARSTFPYSLTMQTD